MKYDGTRRQGMDSRASLQSRRPIVTQGWFQARYIDRWYVQPARAGDFTCATLQPSLDRLAPSPEG